MLKRWRFFMSVLKRSISNSEKDVETAHVSLLAVGSLIASIIFIVGGMSGVIAFHEHLGVATLSTIAVIVGFGFLYRTLFEGYYGIYREEYQRAEEYKNELKKLNDDVGRPGLIALERVLVTIFKPEDPRIIGDDSPRQRSLRITLVFSNSSNNLLLFSIKNTTVAVQGREFSGDSYGSLTMNAKYCREFHCPHITTDFIKESKSTYLILVYKMEYDTVPNVRIRTSEKKINIHVPAQGCGPVTFTVLDEKET